RPRSRRIHSVARGEREVWITQRAHFGNIQALLFGFSADADRGDLVAELEPDVGHDEAEDSDHCRIDALSKELMVVAHNQATDRSLHAVVAIAVLAARENAHREKPPKAINTVDRNGADGIVDTHVVPEKDAQNHQDASDRPDG